MNFRLVMNIRTISSIHKGFGFMNTRFFYSDTVLCTEQVFACSFCYAVFGSVKYLVATPFRVSATIFGLRDTSGISTYPTKR